MIVEIHDKLFLPEHADDALLLSILRQGMYNRYRVITRPAFNPSGERPANDWLERQTENARETARLAFRRGLSREARQWPVGRSEPHVVLEVREQPAWPRCFDDEPARLPLDHNADILLHSPLCLKLENEIGDWYFLKRIVPSTWRRRWQQAEDQRWLKQEQGGGLTEIRRVLEEELQGDHFRRLRMWTMFDSDSRAPGEPDQEAQRTRAACEQIGVPFHMLERRMNENYLPGPTLRRWAAEIVDATKRTTNKSKLQGEAARLDKKISEYCELPLEQRSVVKLKEHDKFARKVNVGPLASIWKDCEISEDELIEDGWDSERHALFLSLFASL
jgi:hypothetical protein